MGADIFISYPSKEKQAADGICSQLEAGELTCWIAPRDIPPGGDWADSIMSGIAGCRLLVVVISKQTGESSHVLREVERAVNRGVPLLPVRIDETIPDGNLGYFLGTSHWFEAQGGEIDAVGGSLRKAAKDLIEGQGVPAGRHTPGPIPGFSRRAFIAGAVALVLIATAIGWLLLGNEGGGKSDGATEAVRLSGDATALVAAMSESTDELTQTINRAESTEQLAAGFQKAGKEATRIASGADDLAGSDPGQGELVKSGTNLEEAADNLEAIADSSAVPGLTEARAAKGEVEVALTSLERALAELRDELTSRRSFEAADSVSASLRQLRSNRDALLRPYSALVRAL